MITMQVNQIISRALKIIRGESAFQSENQDARQYVLETLNDLLALMNSTGSPIPYWRLFGFNLEASVATYILGTSTDATVITPTPFSMIDYVNILINQFRYPIEIQDNFAFLDNTLPLQISGQPSMVRINRQENAMRLNFWPTPNTTYQCEILYKNTIQPVEYQENIALPPEYRAYLVYLLAKRINIENALGTWDAVTESELQRIENTLYAAVEKDNRIRSRPPMVPWSGWYYWNLGVRS